MLLLSAGLSGCKKAPDPHSIEVSFTAPSPLPTYYEVFRTTTNGIYDTTPYLPHLESTHFVDTNVKAGEIYYYRIKSVRDDGHGVQKSGMSEEAMAVVPTP